MSATPSYTQHRKVGPRAEYRRQVGERVRNSATLAQRFVEMKFLTVNLAYSSPEGLAASGQLKYTVNLAFARSLFLFDCPNQECVQGDFDLSIPLANAVAARQTTVSGQAVCQGWRSKATIDQVPCGHILHYTLTIEY